MGEPKHEIELQDVVSVRVNHLRFINKLKQKELALRMGLGASTLNAKLQGSGKWGLEDAIALSRVFGVSIDYLIGNEPLENAAPTNEKTPSEEGVSIVTPVAEAGLDPATSRL